jgi:hypothetical protein
MVESFQDLKFTILIAFVLENLLDRYCFAGLRDGCLKHHTEGAIANDFLSVVS